jgi:hypothetical protein
MLSGVRLDPSRIEVTMPPILQRDANMLNATLSTMVGIVDPQISDRDLMRFYVGEVLDAMGKTNTQELLDKFFPEDWESPAEVANQQQLMFAAMQNQQDPNQVAGLAAGQTEDAEEYDSAARNGTQRGARDYEGGGGGAGAEARDRASRRRELALEGGANVDFEIDGETLTIPAPLVEAVKLMAADGERVGD